MDDKWPPRNAKDAFIEYLLRMDIGETTQELDEEWEAYCAFLDRMGKEATDDPPGL